MPVKKQEKKPVKYKIVYRDKVIRGGQLIKFTLQLPDIRRLAQALNAYVKRNPEYEVVACYIVDDNDIYVSKVHFLEEEYSAQRWLTGWKERVLAEALKRGYDLNWNTGLSTK